MVHLASKERFGYYVNKKLCVDRVGRNEKMRRYLATFVGADDAAWSGPARRRGAMFSCTPSRLPGSYRAADARIE